MIGSRSSSARNAIQPPDRQHNDNQCQEPMYNINEIPHTHVTMLREEQLLPTVTHFSYSAANFHGILMKKALNLQLLKLNSLLCDMPILVLAGVAFP